MSGGGVRRRRPSIQRLSIATPPTKAAIGVGVSDPNKLTKRTLLNIGIVYFSVFLDNMGVSIVQPILPFYAEMFHASSLQLGALYSSYSGAAAISVICMGRVSDRYGRRRMVLFSLFGTMVGFLTLGLAQTYLQLLLFRIFTGAFGGTYALAQAYVTDVVPVAVRPKYLALCGATIAISFIFGPAIGSGLAQFGIRVPFFVSSGMGLCGLVFAFFLLQESLPRIVAKNKEKQRAKEERRQANLENKKHTLLMSSKKVREEGANADSNHTNTNNKQWNMQMLEVMDEETSEMDHDFMEDENGNEHNEDGFHLQTPVYDDDDTAHTNANANTNTVDANEAGIGNIHEHEVKTSDIIIVDKEEDEDDLNQNPEASSSTALTNIGDTNKIPTAIWIISLCFMCVQLGWTAFQSMFALYMIETYQLTTINIGFISLSMAVVYIFTNVLPFNYVSKRIGIYITALIGNILLCLSFLVTPFANELNLWLMLFVLVFGLGIGYGFLMPSVAAMGADFTNELNRGKILGMVSVANHVSVVIGPLLHGFLFEVNIHYPFYVASVFELFGLCILLFILFKYPWTTTGKCDCLRNQKITNFLNQKDGANAIPLNTDFMHMAEDDNQQNMGEQSWAYVPDKATEADYLQLGKDLGTLLTKQHYQWVTWRQQLIEYFPTVFPDLPIVSKDVYLANANFVFHGDDEDELVADLEHIAL